MNLRVNGFFLLIGLLIGGSLVYKFMPRPNLVCSVTKEDRKTTRSYVNGKLSNEVVIESIVKPIPNPKPRYKITLFPVYSFYTGSLYYGLLYEKRYEIPILGDSYLGIYVNSRLEAGFSLSKEFY